MFARRKAVPSLSIPATAVGLFRRVFLFVALCGWTAVCARTVTKPDDGKIQVEFLLPADIPQKAITGRIFLSIASTNEAEPRFHSQSLFGLDVRQAAPGEHVIMNGSVPGDPESMLSHLAPGEYHVQALLNVYTEFRRADGHTVWAHMDQWDGQDINRSPGNYFSQTQTLRVVEGTPARLQVRLENRIPTIELPADTQWVQRVKMESPRLTQFWGRPIYLGATILLPKGYAEHPEQYYPVVYLQGHFDRGSPFGFNPDPDPNAKKSWVRQCEEAVAKHLPPPAFPPGTEHPGSLSNRETGHEFYEAWNSDDFPRVIVVTFQHPTPYFDDSYGVNSPNCGPYGDAIHEELIPLVEQRYRTIRAASARVLVGTSTGGWGALAMLLYHPDFYGGAWAFSPDPVDFRLYYGGVNLYQDGNAFVEKPGPEFEGGGESNREGSRRCAILGTQDGKFEWWKHTPVGPDGYPLPVWDLATGKVDRAVVESMRANNFDLREFLARNWSELGPKLNGKLHLTAAEKDGFYSNLAVHLFEEFLKGTRNPHVDAEFQYGPVGSHHGWQPISNAALIRKMAQQMKTQNFERP
jgi:pimeloyl-ACP methyl ester carboxylesterase